MQLYSIEEQLPHTHTAFKCSTIPITILPSCRKSIDLGHAQLNNISKFEHKGGGKHLNNRTGLHLSGITRDCDVCGSRRWRHEAASLAERWGDDAEL